METGDFLSFSLILKTECRINVLTPVMHSPLARSLSLCHSLSLALSLSLCLSVCVYRFQEIMGPFISVCLLVLMDHSGRYNGTKKIQRMN